MKEEHEDDLSMLEQQVAKKVTAGDIYHKVFLKPIEIQLKTNRNDKNVPINSLPQGLKIVLKEASVFENKYETVDIKPLSLTRSSYAEMKQDSTDNLLSLLRTQLGYEARPKNTGVADSSTNINAEQFQQNIINSKFELAICICMYSQTRTMLKDTLKGVEENIQLLVKNGMDPNSIGVFVILDGIQKADQSIASYFEQLERESYIFLGRNNNPSYNPQDLIQQGHRQEEGFDMFGGIVEKNLNTFVFDTFEIDDREDRRFASVRDQYQETKKMIKQIQQLKKQCKVVNNGEFLYNKLPTKIQKEFFIRIVIENKIKQLGSNFEMERKIKKMSEEELLQDLIFNPDKTRVIAMQALEDAEEFCHQYINTRDSLSYLACFRKRVFLHQYQEAKSEGELVEEIDHDSRFTHMNLFMCIKYQNGGKLSSHNWFFNGFCKELNPTYSILLDVGLRPEYDALFKMYYHLRENPKVGGVCGYMSLKMERVDEEEEIADQQIDCLSNIFMGFADIQKAQQMEYHFAHVLDKPFEAIFKFIHVLPGAFSGYSMSALKSKEGGDKLLKQYFKSIDDKLKQNKIIPSDLTLGKVILRCAFPQGVYQLCYPIDPHSEEQMLYNENVFLAEDRILCMEIHKNQRDLVFLPDSRATVDPIKTVHGLMGQRKRWINGSFFAFDKVKNELSNFRCECGLWLQIFYLTFMNMLGYFSIALFLFTLHISMIAVRNDFLQNIIKPSVQEKTLNLILDFFTYTMDFIYALTILSLVFFSLNLSASRKQFKYQIYLISTILGIFSLVVFVIFSIEIIRGLISGSSAQFLQTNNVEEIPGGKLVLDVLRYVLVGVIGVYIVPLLLYWCFFCRATPLCQTIKDAFSFIFYTPTYLIMLNTYAICRIDDISWGTKGLDSGAGNAQSKLQQKWKLIKTMHVCKYVIWNGFLGAVLITLGQYFIIRFFITISIMGIIVLTLFFKLFIAIVYLTCYRCCNSYPDQPQKYVEVQISPMNKELFKRLRKDVLEESKIRCRAIIDQKEGGTNIQNSVNLKTKMASYKINKKVLQKDMHKNISQSRIRSKITKKGNKKKQLKKIDEQEEKIETYQDLSSVQKRKDKKYKKKPNNGI